MHVNHDPSLQVVELRERANAIFKLGRYEQALGLYQKAIRLAFAG
jgi:hypothetical protein